MNSLQLARTGQIADRYSKAIEQLGTPDSKDEKKIDVRLGGIYALQSIANGSKDLHWPIMEVLCAYVRNHAPLGPTQPNPVSLSSVHPSSDIQAILTVLGRRKREYESPGPPQYQALDLSHTDLRGADLSQAHLENALLNESNLDHVNLDEAYLNPAQGRRAILTNAHLSRTNFGGADFYGANFGGAYCRDAINLPVEHKIDATGHCQ